MGALRDNEPELRRMAAFALGEMDDIKAAPLLAGALRDQDAETRAMAAEALGKLKDPASVPALMSRLDDADPRVVGMTFLALWKIDAGELLSRQIEKALAIYRSSNGEPRWQAAYFLMRAQMGHSDDDRIETALLESSADKDPLIRSYAARGLGASKSAQATQRLVELADDDDWRVQVNAFNGLRTRRVESEGHARGRWKVYKRALADKRSAVAVSALAALESCAAPEAREYLVKTLGDPRPRFREVAALALAAKDKSAALALIRPLAADPIWSVR
ncbi:MAG TPA: HEAT repeat domain-containing protein, partial [Ktedonobacterales bacterium]|nr:HEAT repeat domain-containing protein [Ktedonobacterales bacterium]